MPVEMEREEFEAVVGAALDEIPDDLAAVVRNVVVLVEDDAPAEDHTAGPLRRCGLRRDA